MLQLGMGCAVAWRMLPTIVSSAVTRKVVRRPNWSPRTPKMICPVSAPTMAIIDTCACMPGNSFP